jgi:hypothetical protein
MTNFTQLIDALDQYRGHIEFEYANSWLKIKIKDRFFLAKEKLNIQNIFEDHGFFNKFQLTTSWNWTKIQYENYILNNPNIQYEYFISSFDLLKGKPLQISDTTDPLHDICLFALRDKINKVHQFCTKYDNLKSCPLFYSFFRGVNCYFISFYTQTEAKQFEHINPFNRKMSWQLKQQSGSTKRVYICQLYYTDKEQFCPNIPLTDVIKRKQINQIPEKPLTQKELFDKVKAGEITFEEFEKILQKDKN